MAQDMVTVMEQLGFTSFRVVGHDRGGRVAYRLTLDHPTRVTHLAVLDIIRTETAWAHADARFALAYWPWSLFAQPAPLPEQIMLAAPEAIVDAALGGWGSPATVFSPDIRAAYVQALSRAGHWHCGDNGVITSRVARSTRGTSFRRRRRKKLQKPYFALSRNDRPACDGVLISAHLVRRMIWRFYSRTASMSPARGKSVLRRRQSSCSTDCDLIFAKRDDMSLNAYELSAKNAQYDLHRYTLADQVHWAAEGAKLAIAQMLGEHPVPARSDAKSFSDLYRRLDAAITYLQEITPGAIEASLDRTVVIEHRRGCG